MWQGPAPSIHRALLFAAVWLVGIGCARAVPPDADAASVARIATILTTLPFAFEPLGDGGMGSPNRFLARGLGYRVALAPTDVQLHTSRRLPQAGSGETRATRIIDLHFIDGKDDAEAEGLDPLATRTHYFVGDARSHRADVATFTRVRFHEIYRGIDIHYYGRNGQLEFDLIVQPGADTSTVKLSVAGADLALDPSGNVVIGSGEASAVLQRPASYQLIDGVRRHVESDFILNSGKEIGIVVGAYDRAKPLIIDPVVAYASYLGGKGLD